MPRSAEEWLASYAAELGIPPPTEAELDQLLELAGVAAHASERKTAPITCWLAARAGAEPAHALAVGRHLAAAAAVDGG
jgi:hypothetical protein